MLIFIKIHKTYTIILNKEVINYIILKKKINEPQPNKSSKGQILDNIFFFFFLLIRRLLNGACK